MVSKIIPIKSVESTAFKRFFRRLVGRLFLPYPEKLRFSRDKALRGLVLTVCPIP